MINTQNDMNLQNLVLASQELIGWKDPNLVIQQRMLNYLFSQREYESYIKKSRPIGFTESQKNQIVLKPYDYGSNYHRQSVMNYLTRKHFA